MASSLAIAAIPVGGAGSLAIMALGYYGRLQGATAQLGAVDSARLQKEVTLSEIEEKITEFEFGTKWSFHRLNRESNDDRP